MLKALVFSLAFIVPGFVLAQPITLSPGSSVEIYGETIYCQAGPGSNPQLPLCRVVHTQNYYDLMSGASLMETFGTFDAAVDGAKKARAAGLCL